MQPDEFQQISETTFMQRKDIEKKDHKETDGSPAYSEYVCQCRELTVAEYARIRADQNAADAAYAIMLVGGDIDE